MGLVFLLLSVRLMDGVEKLVRVVWVKCKELVE